MPTNLSGPWLKMHGWDHLHTQDCLSIGGVKVPLVQLWAESQQSHQLYGLSSVELKPKSVMVNKVLAPFLAILPDVTCAPPTTKVLSPVTPPWAGSISCSTQIPCKAQELQSFFVFRQAVTESAHLPIFQGSWEARRFQLQPSEEKAREQELSDAALTDSTLRGWKRKTRLRQSPSRSPSSSSFTTYKWK